MLRIVFTFKLFADIQFIPHFWIVMDEWSPTTEDFRNRLGAIIISTWTTLLYQIVIKYTPDYWYNSSMYGSYDTMSLKKVLYLIIKSYWIQIIIYNGTLFLQQQLMKATQSKVNVINCKSVSSLNEGRLFFIVMPPIWSY
jgi:hypothetical protein